MADSSTTVTSPNNDQNKGPAPTTQPNNQLPQSKFGLGSDNSDLIVLALKYFRIVGLVFFVWLLGYFGFSVAWILVASFVYLWRERTRNLRELKSEMIRAVQLDEKNAILARLDEVPSWVFFPDKERAEWVNKILKQIWPYFCKFMNKEIKDTIEPIIQGSIPSVVGQIKFDKIDLGDIPPRIGSVKVYTERVLENEIMIDLEVLYAGDAKVKLETKKMLVGVKSIQFQGEMRVILKPLSERIPLFAAMTMFFLRTPSFDFDLTEIGNLVDLPVINEGLKTAISDVLGKMLVLPNRLVIPIIPDFNLVDMNALMTPHPKGVLRINIMRAINLKKADLNILGQGKSDPYVKIHGCGNKEYRTKVIENNINPEWNEVFHFAIEDLEGNTKLRLDVYDKDLKNDDFLGGLAVDVQQIIAKGIEEGVYTLKEVKKGQLKLRFDWFYLSNQRDSLAKTKQFARNPINNSPLAISMLIMHFKHVNDLPNVVKKVGGMTEPNPCAVISVGNTTYTTATQTNTTNPHFDENFFFMIENPEHDIVHIKIMDKKTDKQLCKMEYGVAELLDQPNLSTDRQFNLDCPGYSSRLTMALSLKIFSLDDPEDETDEPIVVVEKKPEENNNSKASTSDLPRNASAGESFADSKSQPSSNSLSAIEPTYKECEGIRHRSVIPNQSTVMSMGNGKISLTLKYDLQKNLFSVQVHRCTGLSSVHSNHLPDPYVRLYLMPDTKSKKRTRSIKDTLNPVYDETFDWNIHFSELQKRTLEISIKNEKPFLSTEKVYMGEISLDLSQMDLESPVTGAFDLRERHESRFILDRLGHL